MVERLNEETKAQLERAEHPLDVCFMVSVLEQQFDKCGEFAKDITENVAWIGAFTGDPDHYSNGKIAVGINDGNYYYYEIGFQYAERMWGYCQCTPGDEGYSAAHRCCGHGCDWVAPTVVISKIVGLGTIEWNGDASTYWAYQEQFKLNQERYDKEAAAFTRKQRRESLLQSIEQYKEDLRQLDAEEADS